MDDQRYDDLCKLLWSKVDRKNQSDYHLFIYHLLDSGAVAFQFCQKSLSHSIKVEVANWLSLDMETSGRMLAYWCALHDIGKASPVFQAQQPNLSKIAEQAGLPFEKQMDKKVYHSLSSGKFLRESNLVPQQIDIAISGHHGTWNCDYGISKRSYGGAEWQDFRKTTQEKIKKILDISNEIFQDFPEGEESNVFTTWFSGFVTVVDWIASNEDYFHYKSECQDLDKYYQYALEQADIALNKLGWVNWKPKGENVTFREMFPFPARPIQTRVIELYEKYDPQEPFIMVIEAPTGIGKTELSLYLADRWLQQSGGSGLYIAMPTKATSNQIYERTTKIIKDRYPADLIPIVLAHGQAMWNESVNNIRIKEIGEENKQTVVAAEWFQNNRKRSLLTPFGVGTVDQVFLSILQTRHFFVRLFGLKNKVVIFDEVHAYDLYMQELFKALLRWLRSLGVAVIILSATLPQNFRKQIIADYCGEETDSSNNDAYPCFTLATPGQKPQIHGLQDSIPEDQERRLQMIWIDETSLVSELKKRLENGGCVAVICNTVVRAQEVYKEIRKENLVPKDDLYLFHARFPQAWRQEKEETILRIFGKDTRSANNTQDEDMNPERPHKAIVVATQVIEQSLDLDFDLMVSEVAPVDLVLQRAGRLWRHTRSRPKGMNAPELILIEPNKKDEKDMPSFGRSAHVYDGSILLKSYLTLKDIKILETIRETRALIEQVYGGDNSFVDSAGFGAELDQMELVEDEKGKVTRAKAESMVIAKPDHENLLYGDNLELCDDEDSVIHQSYKALTRDTDGLSLNLICLHKQGDTLYTDPQGQTHPVDLNRLERDNDLLVQVLRQEISINRSDVVLHLLGCNRLIHLDKVAALRHRRIMVFESGRFETEEFQFELSKDLGLVIKKRK